MGNYQEVSSLGDLISHEGHMNIEWAVVQLLIFPYRAIEMVV